MIHDTQQTLKSIAVEARKAGLEVDWDSKSRLIITVTFTDPFLRNLSGEVHLLIRETLVGHRYVILESLGGTMLTPAWAEKIGCWLEWYLRRWCSPSYWWSFRHVWGWQVSHPWIGLKPALAHATDRALTFERYCRFPELIHER